MQPTKLTPSTMPTTIRLNNRAFVVLGIAGLLALAALAFASRAHAETTPTLTFPIPELGGCASREACKAYCSDSVNQSACQAFAVSHNLKAATSTDDGVKLKAIKANGGPGNCAKGATDPKAACKAYCDSTEHMDECVSYGKDHRLFTADRLGKALKAQMTLPHATTTPLIKTQADFRLYLSHAPEVVKKCVISTIGERSLNSIASGSTTPDMTVGAKIKACFERNRPIMPRSAHASTTDRGGSEGRLKEMGRTPALPPKVKDCLVAKYGADLENQLSQGQPKGEFAQAVARCYQTVFGANAAQVRKEAEHASTTSPLTRPVPPGTRPPFETHESEASGPTSFGDFLRYQVSGLAASFSAFLR